MMEVYALLLQMHPKVEKSVLSDQSEILSMISSYMTMTRVAI